jgi:hypothetical protein
MRVELTASWTMVDLLDPKTMYDLKQIVGCCLRASTQDMGLACVQNSSDPNSTYIRDVGGDIVTYSGQ